MAQCVKKTPDILDAHSLRAFSHEALPFKVNYLEFLRLKYALFRVWLFKCDIFNAKLHDNRLLCHIYKQQRQEKPRVI